MATSHRPLFWQAFYGANIMLISRKSSSACRATAKISCTCLAAKLLFGNSAKQCQKQISGAET
jgi:hypothetical protein